VNDETRTGVDEIERACHRMLGNRRREKQALGARAGEVGEQQPRGG